MKFLGLLFFCWTTFANAWQLTPLVSSGLDSPLQVVTLRTEPGAYYIVQQGGKIRVWENGRFRSPDFLDISDKVLNQVEMGLLSLAFHPDYANNGRYFINYNPSAGQLATIVAERARGSVAERELLKFSQPFKNHNGGHMLFGPDGYLYIASGDGGSGGDPQGNGQNLGTLLGKILRIDVNGQKPFAIPADNPFVGMPGAKPEIFAYGLRNPWKMAFDPITKKLWTGDVGQNRFEEIDIIERGKNYGWKIREAKHCFPSGENCQSEGLEPPVWEYPRTDGISITGGLVYRGLKFPELVGSYIYGDFGTGNIWSLKYDFNKKRVASNTLLLSGGGSISSFGEDLSGEILVVNYSGSVSRLTK